MAIVGALIIDLLYTVISLVLVGIVGQALTRNSRAFLPQRFGPDGMAEAVCRILVVAYYLLALGFIALSMPTWGHVRNPGQAMELLSGQVGILLLMLGALHLAGTAVLARLRRGHAGARAAAGPGRYAGRTAADPAGAGTGGAGTGGAGPGGAGPDSAGAAPSGPDGTGPDGAGPDGADPDGADPDGADPGGSGTGGSGTSGRSGAGTGTRIGSPALWRPKRGDAVP
jgi:hypothetical protein